MSDPTPEDVARLLEGEAAGFRSCASAWSATAPHYDEPFTARAVLIEAAARTVRAMAEDIAKLDAILDALDIADTDDDPVAKIEEMHVELERGRAEVQPAAPIEVRRRKDGTLDEVVARGCNVHLERLDRRQWGLVVQKNDRRVVVWLGSSYSIGASIEINGQMQGEPDA